MRGTVERWFSEKGFGFIKASGLGEDVFVHHTSIDRGGERGRVDLEVGSQVEFELESGPKGKAAKNVRTVG